MWLASGRASWGPNTAATSGAWSKPSSSAASQPSCAGVASWVRKATWSPLASSISRLRVPPCENSSGAISRTTAPCRRAISCEPSVEPESTTRISASVSACCARTARSTSSRYRDPFRTGIATVNTRLQLLGYAGSFAVEHPEAEHQQPEHDPDRDQQPQRTPGRMRPRWRPGVDEHVPDLGEQGGDRAQHQQMLEPRRRQRLDHVEDGGGV